MDEREQNQQSTSGRSRQDTTHRQRRHPRKEGRLPIGFIIKTLLLIFICTGVIFTGIFAVYIATCIIPNAHVDVSEISMSQSSVIFYENSEGEWEELETLHGGKNSIWADYDTMPEYLSLAAIAIEDKRFLQHNGVDWRRTAAAVVNLFVHYSDDTFGGSTLTQQTIKNVTGDKEGTVKRKITEIFRALDFEKTHSKEDIMELYLNNIYLGHGCYGVKTAAQVYFGKDVSELTLAECTDLIGITNNPSLYDPYNTEATLQNNLERKDTILYEMYDQGKITKEEYDEAVAQELVFTNGSDDEDDSQYYSWFVDQVINDVIEDLQVEKGYTKEVATQMVYYGGLNIYCTQDLEVQACVDEVYENRDNLPYTSQGYEMQSAITIIDPYTGNIVAMAGGMGEKQGSRLFNYATAKRQCGSAIKPISSYAPALDAGVITPASVLDDAPVRTLNGRAWPVNSHSYYDGLVSVDTAIAESLNPCAVRVVEALGIQESYDFMTEKLGFSSLVSSEDNPDRNDMNSASLGLGGLTRGVSTVEMAAAYAIFPNNGVYNEPRTYTKITDQDGNVILDNTSDSWQAVDEVTAYFMNNYLRQVITSGTGGSAGFSGMTVAGKTGTTTDNYDRYFVGYTPYYVAAVWTGYEKNIKINASGNPSAKLFRQVMSKVHANLPNKSFSTPDGGMTRVTVCMDCGNLASDLCASDIRGSRVRQVLVAAGTAPTTTCTCHVAIQWCNEGEAIASEFCPADQVVEKSAVDYTRTDAAAAGNCRDEEYHLAALQSEERQCKVHTAETAVDPDDPNTPVDPEDPTTDPDDPSHSVDPEDPTTDPDTPTDPNDPATDQGAPTDPNQSAGGNAAHARSA